MFTRLAVMILLLKGIFCWIHVAILNSKSNKSWHNEFSMDFVIFVSSMERALGVQIVYILKKKLKSWRFFNIYIGFGDCNSFKSTTNASDVEERQWKKTFLRMATINNWGCWINCSKNREDEQQIRSTRIKLDQPKKSHWKGIIVFVIFIRFGQNRWHKRTIFDCIFFFCVNDQRLFPYPLI